MHVLCCESQRRFVLALALHWCPCAFGHSQCVFGNYPGVVGTRQHNEPLPLTLSPFDPNRSHSGSTSLYTSSRVRLNSIGLTEAPCVSPTFGRTPSVHQGSWTNSNYDALRSLMQRPIMGSGTPLFSMHAATTVCKTHSHAHAICICANAAISPFPSSVQWCFSYNQLILSTGGRL